MSTDEKLGAEALLLALPPLVPPDAALPPEDDVLDDPLLGRLEEPLELPPEAALPLLGELVEPAELPPAAEGEDEVEDLSLLMPVLPDDELCALATPDSANSAAAVAMLTNFRFNIS